MNPFNHKKAFRESIAAFYTPYRDKGKVHTCKHFKCFGYSKAGIHNMLNRLDQDDMDKNIIVNMFDNLKVKIH